MMTIRPMCAQDLDAICAIEQACFAVPWTRADFEGELQNPLALYLVAVDAAAPDVPAGYAGAWIVVDECHITNVAVSPSFRRRGAARELLTKLLEQAQLRGARAATLEVRPSNAAALALYTSMGFVQEGRRRRYYSDTGEDALILWRNHAPMSG